MRSFFASEEARDVQASARVVERPCPSLAARQRWYDRWTLPNRNLLQFDASRQRGKLQVVDWKVNRTFWLEPFVVRCRSKWSFWQH